MDEKPKRSPRLKRLANVRANPAATVLVDAYDEDWSRLSCVRLDGHARVLEEGAECERALLAGKYPQYRQTRAPARIVSAQYGHSIVASPTVSTRSPATAMAAGASSVDRESGAAADMESAPSGSGDGRVFRFDPWSKSGSGEAQHASGHAEPATRSGRPVCRICEEGGIGLRVRNQITRRGRGWGVVVFLCDR